MTVGRNTPITELTLLATIIGAAVRSGHNPQMGLKLRRDEAVQCPLRCFFEEVFVV
jgi:hypothetical protein